MLTILAITGPIFILIGLGFAAVRMGLLSRAEMRPLGVFVIHVALPALLFKTMTQGRLGAVVNGHLLLAYTLGSLIAAGVGLAVARFVFKRDLLTSAVQAMGMGNSNSAFIGYPIALQVFGPAASSALAAYALIESLLMMPLTQAVCEVAGSKGGRWGPLVKGILQRLARNPFILAIAAGVAWSLTGIPLPLPLAKAVDMLSTTSAPVALFCIGGTLAGLHLKGMLGDVGLIVAGKLALHPLCVFGVLLVLPIPDPQLQGAAILNAAMPMMSIYPLLSQKFGKEGMAAAALVAATVTSFFTISALLWVMGH